MKKALFLTVVIIVLTTKALCSTVTVSAYSLSNLPFNPSSIGTSRSITVVATNGSATVTSSAAFPANIVGIAGFQVLINGTQYVVASVASTSSLTLTSNYGGSTGSQTMTLYAYVLLRAYATAGFQDNVTGQNIMPGAPGSGNFYKQVAVSVINSGSGNVAYLPEFTIPSTTDALINANARYQFGFYTSAGAFLAFYQCGAVVQLALQPNTPTTWTAICNYNAAGPPPPPPNTYYTAQQIDQRFPSCTAGQSYYFAANGNIVSCLNFGSGLTLTGNTLTASGGGGGSGTVTSFSSGNLSPLFTTAVANATTTPALTFSLSSQTANTVFAGPTSGGSAAPTFRALVLADLPASITLTATQVSANYTALVTDWAISVDTSGGNRTVTLYAASNTGKLLSVCKATTDGNTVTISDGTLSEVIYSPATCMQFLATGSAWKVQSY